MSLQNGLATVPYSHHVHGRRPPIHCPDLLTTGEVAMMLGCSPRTVTQWIDSGRLKGFRLPRTRNPLSREGGDRRVHRKHLAAFVRDNHLDVDVGILADPPAPVVLAIGCEVLEPVAGTEVVTAPSAFAAGMVVVARRPALIVADIALGRLELTQITEGCRGIEGYEPVLVVACPEADLVLVNGWDSAITRPVHYAVLVALLPPIRGLS